MIHLDKRHLLIIRHLINATKPLSSEVLSSALGYSSKTIRSDIKIITKILENVGANVVSKSGYGYSIHIYNTHEFDIFLQFFNDKYWNQVSIPYFHEPSIKYMLYRILFGKNISISDLENELYINTKKIHYFLSVCQTILIRYHLDLKRNNNKLSVIGKEQHLRILIADLMYLDEDMTFNLSERELFDASIDSKYCLDFIQETLYLNQIRLSNQSIFFIRNQILVLSTRIKQKKQVELKEVEIKNIMEFKEYMIASYIIEVFFGMPIQEEACNLTLLLVSRRNFSLEDKYSLQDNSSSYFLGDEMLRFLFLHVNCDFSKDYDIRLYLAREMRGMMVRLINGFEYKNTSMLKIKQNTISYEYAIIMSDYLSKKYKCKVPEEEIAILSNILHLFLIRNQKEEMIHSKKIYLVFQNGMNESLSIKEKIYQLFYQYIDVIKSIEYFEWKHLKEEVIMITDMPTSSFLNAKKVLQVKNGLDAKERNELFQELADVKEKCNLFMKAFHENTIYLNIEARDRISLLKKVSDNIKKDYKISGQFEAMLLSYISASNTEKGNNMAIIQTLFPVGRQPHVAIVILKKAIIWDKELVRIIFIIANGSDEKTYFHMKYLQKMTRDIDFVHQLITTRKEIEILNIMSGYFETIINSAM